MNSTKPHILIILGPTAVGKSDLAVQLAQKFNGEIVSADSRQIYKGLNVGTGKITKAEMKGTPHHMLDIADPKDKFSVAQYIEQSEKVITEIVSRGKLPIICGGTGFYIQALVDGSIFPEVEPNEKLRAELSTKSAGQLAEQLKKLDPKRHASFNHDDSKNPRRLIRAIEIATQLGSAPVLADLPTNSKYDPLFIGLNVEPSVLKDRIRTRLLKRFESGMVEEVQHLHEQGLSWERLDELGLEYRYIARFLQNNMNKGDVIRVLNLQIEHYAKRQMTWFKKNKRIQWFKPDEVEAITKKVEGFL